MSPKFKVGDLVHFMMQGRPASFGFDIPVLEVRWTTEKEDTGYQILYANSEGNNVWSHESHFILAEDWAARVLAR